jgi:hypothetical protein
MAVSNKTPSFVVCPKCACAYQTWHYCLDGSQVWRVEQEAQAPSASQEREQEAEKVSLPTPADNPAPKCPTCKAEIGPEGHQCPLDLYRCGQCKKLYKLDVGHQCPPPPPFNYQVFQDEWSDELDQAAQDSEASARRANTVQEDLKPPSEGQKPTAGAKTSVSLSCQACRVPWTSLKGCQNPECFLGKKNIAGENSIKVGTARAS